MGTGTGTSPALVKKYLDLAKKHARPGTFDFSVHFHSVRRSVTYPEARGVGLRGPQYDTTRSC